jgi:hypothetical protein
MKSILLIAFSFVTFSAFAQNNAFMPPPPPPGETNIPDTWGSRYFHFGLNFTPGIYWVIPNSSNGMGKGAFAGYGYGANLEFYFTRNYGFLTGFEITTISARYANSVPNPNPNAIDSTTTNNESLQYLQFPLLLKMKTNSFGKIRYYGVVGFEVGFLLKATDNYNTLVIPNGPYPVSTFMRPYSGNDVNVYDQTDFFRCSLVIGGGFEYSIAGSTALQASLTYNNCFTNMNSSGSNAANIKGIELMIGILF